MIRCEGLRVIWIIAERCQRTAIENSFNFDNGSVEGVDVEDGASRDGSKMALKESDDSLPHPSIVGCSRRDEIPPKAAPLQFGSRRAVPSFQFLLEDIVGAN